MNRCFRVSSERNIGADSNMTGRNDPFIVTASIAGGSGGRSSSEFVVTTMTVATPAVNHMQPGRAKDIERQMDSNKRRYAGFVLTLKPVCSA